MTEEWHVTDVIRAAGLMGQWLADEYALERGRAVHKAIHYWLQDDLDEGSVAPEIMPYLRQFQAFWEKSGLELLASEERVSHRTLDYCGTLDIRARDADGEIIIDIKTGAPAKWHGPQLAAYAATFERPIRRAVLHLGEFYARLFYCRDRDDWRAFVAALTLIRWRGDVCPIRS